MCYIACAELRGVPAHKPSLRFANNAGFVSNTPRLAYAHLFCVKCCICCTTQEELP